jgi:hypothetical protein
LENVYRRFGCNRRYKLISFHVTGIKRSAGISIDMNSHIVRAGNGVDALFKLNILQYIKMSVVPNNDICTRIREPAL